MSPLAPAAAPPLRRSEIGQREALGDLLDHCFGVGEGHHFFEDFPIWDPAIVPSGPRLIRLGAWDRDRLVAAAGLRLAELALAGGNQEPKQVPVALIGAVATDPAFRGHGLASDLTAELVERARGAGAAVALLWGSEHRMYARLGFELAGSQIRAPIARLRLDGAVSAVTPTPVSKIFQGWVDPLFELIRNRERGVRLESTDLTWYRAHRNVGWFRAEQGGRIVAYAGLGRGIDLKNVVHEWGGDSKALAALLRHIQALCPEAELLGPSDSDVFGLKEHPSERLALVKPLTPAGAALPLWVWGLDAV